MYWLGEFNAGGGGAPTRWKRGEASRWRRNDDRRVPGCEQHVTIVTSSVVGGGCEGPTASKRLHV
jgi:hypothetical protein